MPQTVFSQKAPSRSTFFDPKLALNFFSSKNIFRFHSQRHSPTKITCIKSTIAKKILVCEHFTKVNLSIFHVFFF